MNKNMKLYFSKGACSLAPRIVINELKLPCEFESVDLKSKQTNSGEDFLKINPKGYVPVLITPNGETLTENAVILQYLADTTNNHDLLPPLKEFAHYEVLEWVNFITTELHKAFGALFNQQFPQEAKESITIPLIQKRFAFVNTHIKGTYLMGDRFTLPDAYLFVMLRWAKHFKIDLSQHTNLEKYFNELLNRPSIQQSLKEEGL